MFSRVVGRRTLVRTSLGSAASLRRVGAQSSTLGASRLLSSGPLTLGSAATFGLGVKRAGSGVQRTASHAARHFTNSSFLTATNSAYIDEMYAQWRVNPASVHASWDVFFRTGKYTAPPSLVGDYKPSDAAASAPRAAPVTSSAAAAGSSDAHKLAQLVRNFQVRGHLLADLDPLGLTAPRIDAKSFDITAYGFTEADLDREFSISLPNMDGFMGADRGPYTLRKLVDRLRHTYCDTVGWEFMHIPDVEQCNFLRKHIELKEQRQFSKAEKLTILDRLMWADHFERFLAKKHTTAKRFGLEGGESTIPGMKALLRRSSDLGVDTCVIGMPHRGRLNVLSTVMRKPLEAVLADFEHGHVNEDGTHQLTEGFGDVKYHLGMSIQRFFGNEGKSMHLSLLANPSHLEAVDPVVLGKTRAKQFFKKDPQRHRCMAVLLHGDAAFAGQGVVWETFALSDLPDYTTGGVVHIVVNNQVGFTTDPSVARSTPYCTDLAKAVNAPIFHVNGDDPEAVTHACEVAAEWRQQFKKDVVIDLICYRKHGHNEIDEPRFTQPVMYAKIEKMPSSLQIYEKKLLAEGVVTQAELDTFSAAITAKLQAGLDAAKTYVPKPEDGLSQQWQGLKDTNAFSAPKPTGVPLAGLKELGTKLTTYPADLRVHPILKKTYANRRTMIDTGKGIDWGTAESLAFGSLLQEGHHVRLSGQDVERGTFTHRHAVMHDQLDKHRSYEPLNNLGDKSAFFSVSNSNLSEFAILGFELGYSQENPNSLVLWEAQFGDFVNGAQIIIDQFLSAGEDKWKRQSGLVMLLPHGYEGQGPEHSSARLERFLQNSKEHPDVIVDDLQIQQSNWQVVNCSTPANYFHVLRRQIHREFRKPLIVMSPKALLRQPISTLAEMSEGTRFQQVIGDATLPAGAAADKVRRVIFCSGKVYYDLLNFRTAKAITDVALVRVEQLSPFPFRGVMAEATKYRNARDVVWCQEEPMNMGAWTHVQPRLETAFKAAKYHVTRPKYAGRAPSASTAAGNIDIHKAELAAFLHDAFKP